MRLELIRAPTRLEFLHQIGGAHHFLFQAANQFHRAGIYEADIRDIIFRRILHRDFLAAGQQSAQKFVQFFPARINKFLAGEIVQRALLDSVDQLARLAFRGNEIEPAARGEAVRAQSENAARDGVAMVVVIEKPAVNFAGAEFRLDRLNVGHDFRDPLSIARRRAR